MTLKREYPRRMWSQQLRDAVDDASRRRWLGSLLVDAWCERFDAACRQTEGEAWDEAHYADHTRDELIWRVLFLQGAGRSAWLRAQFWRTRALPFAVFLALVAGFFAERVLSEVLR